MCIQPTYQSDVKTEFKENIEALKKLIDEAEVILLKKYKKKST